MERAAGGREQDEPLLEQAAWIRQEADSLRHIIRAIPFDETLPEGLSVRDELLRFEYIQRTYFLPVFLDLPSGMSREKPEISTLTELSDRFQISQEQVPEVESTLTDIAEQRGEILAVLDSLTAEHWEEVVATDIGSPVSLRRFVEAMVDRDLQTLRSIADSVLVFQKESRAKRELKGVKRGPGQGHSSDSPHQAGANGLE